MKNMRIPLLSALGVAILGIIIGSFLDFQLSSAIASADNGFGLFFSVIGPTIGFCGLSFIGGGFFGPFILGGLTGGLIASSRPNYYPYYQPYPYYGPYPYYPYRYY